MLGRVDLQDLLPEDLLGGTDVTDPLQQLVEVVRGPWAYGVPEPRVIEGEALAYVLIQARGRPLPKQGAKRRPDPIADREDHRKAVVLEIAPNPPRALLANL